MPAGEIQLGVPSLPTLARAHLRDWLTLVLLVVIEVILNLIPPFHRFVSETAMAGLMYPHKANTIPFWAIPLGAALLPLAVILGVYYRQQSARDLHHAALGLLFALLLTGVLITLFPIKEIW